MNKKTEKKPLFQAEKEMPLGLMNYKLLALGFAIIIIGFILMIGTTDIYDFRKTILSPIVVVGGFIFIIYAIMKKPKE